MPGALGPPCPVTVVRSCAPIPIHISGPDGYGKKLSDLEVVGVTDRRYLRTSENGKAETTLEESRRTAASCDMADFTHTLQVQRGWRSLISRNHQKARRKIVACPRRSLWPAHGKPAEYGGYIRPSGSYMAKVPGRPGWIRIYLGRAWPQIHGVGTCSLAYMILG